MTLSGASSHAAEVHSLGALGFSDFVPSASSRPRMTTPSTLRSCIVATKVHTGMHSEAWALRGAAFCSRKVRDGRRSSHISTVLTFWVTAGLLIFNPLRSYREERARPAAPEQREGTCKGTLHGLVPRSYDLRVG